MGLSTIPSSQLMRLIRISISILALGIITSGCSTIAKPTSNEVPIVANMQLGEEHAINQFLIALKKIFDQGLRIDPEDIEREFGFRIFDWRDDRATDGKISGNLVRTQNGSIAGLTGGLTCESKAQLKHCTKLIFGTVNPSFGTVDQSEKEPILTKDAVTRVFGLEFEFRWVEPMSPHGNARPWMIFQNKPKGKEAEIVFELGVPSNRSVGNYYVNAITLTTKRIDKKDN
jgi:hypothetical protein